jgi:hypothetical protein
MNVYALYPSRKFIDAKTRTWVEFLKTHLPQVIARDVALLNEIQQQSGGGEILRSGEPDVTAAQTKH